ncbi:MAG: hypothetical protein JWO48_3023 [Bryobacterales bacterium]|jgi:hypothetical protein|nr:hypothetical protein [Bryobacterales bacterium]
MTSVAILIVNVPSGGLLRIQAKLGVAPAALDFATGSDDHKKQAKTDRFNGPQLRKGVSAHGYVCRQVYDYSHRGGHMKISTVREFRDNASGLLRSKDPILVTRRGRLAGVFFPRPEASFPIELKRELFTVLSSEIAHQIRKRGLREENIIVDFQNWRKTKRETRRRR